MCFVFDPLQHLIKCLHNSEHCKHSSLFHICTPDIPDIPGIPSILVNLLRFLLLPILFQCSSINSHSSFSSIPYTSIPSYTYKYYHIYACHIFIQLFSHAIHIMLTLQHVSPVISPPLSSLLSTYTLATFYYSSPVCSTLLLLLPSLSTSSSLCSTIFLPLQPISPVESPNHSLHYIPSSPIHINLISLNTLPATPLFPHSSPSSFPSLPSLHCPFFNTTQA